MVIVSPEQQGRGIGRELLARVIDSLGARTIFLHATPSGEPLYVKFGFAAIGTIDQHQGAAFQPPLISLPPGERLRPLGVNDGPRLAALASRAAGHARGTVIDALLDVANGIALDRDGELLGFALFRRFGRGHVIGPVIAPDALRAQALISHWLALHEGMFVRLDVPGDSGLSDWLQGSACRASIPSSRWRAARRPSATRRCARSRSSIRHSAEPRDELPVQSRPGARRAMGAALRTTGAGPRVRIWPDLGDAAAVRYLAAWQPPDDPAALLPNLEVIFSVGAGIDQFDLSRVPAHIPVVRMIEPGIVEGMVEYVTQAVLTIHRDLFDYAAQQRAQVWREKPVRAAASRRVGVLGLGTLGQAVLDTLRRFGFPCAGWSRTPRALDGVDCYAGDAALDVFLASTDILICRCRSPTPRAGCWARACSTRCRPARRSCRSAAASSSTRARCSTRSTAAASTARSST
jgi:hypothetical protein